MTVTSLDETNCLTCFFPIHFNMTDLIENQNIDARIAKVKRFLFIYSKHRNSSKLESAIHHDALAGVCHILGIRSFTINSWPDLNDNTALKREVIKQNFEM